MPIPYGEKSIPFLTLKILNFEENLMNQYLDLLDFAKRSIQNSIAEFLSKEPQTTTKITGIELGGKEVKIAADRILEKLLISKISKTGISILSEESGFIKKQTESDLCWVIDPMDGSFNYIRGAGPYAVSLALCKNEKPLFGVIYDLKMGRMTWGGKAFGAFSDGKSIHVSSVKHFSDGVICTGFPARFLMDDSEKVGNLMGLISRFAKVRMIGSAACSLVMVARGEADAYFEDHIMWWDVAAGLAIIEGAGGFFYKTKTEIKWCCTIVAATSELFTDFEKQNF